MNEPQIKEKFTIKSITNDIMLKVLYHMRYKMQAWPKRADIDEMERAILDILREHLRK